MGIEPWPCTWAEYKRMFLGWQRQRWEFFGALCVATANGLLPWMDKRSWRAADFTPLAKPPPRWRKKLKSAAEAFKAAFCGRGEAPSKSSIEDGLP